MQKALTSFGILLLELPNSIARRMAESELILAESELILPSDELSNELFS